MASNRGFLYRLEINEKTGDAYLAWTKLKVVVKPLGNPKYALSDNGMCTDLPHHFIQYEESLLAIAPENANAYSCSTDWETVDGDCKEETNTDGSEYQEYRVPVQYYRINNDGLVKIMNSMK